jgi:hypothetical protein
VKEGTLKLNGMPPSPHLTDEQLEQIRYYLRARAKQAPEENAALKSGHPPGSSTATSQALSKGM